MINKCCYCNNILSSGTNDTNKLPWNEILFDSASYVVTPTLGSFIEGWTLIISKRHITSMSQLSISEVRELNSLLSHVRNKVEQIYGPTIVFEHGPMISGTEFGCGIDHAHFHIVPFNHHVIPLVERELPGIEWRQVVRLEDILQESKSYLYICDFDEEYGVISNPNDIQSQFMRRVLAKNCGMLKFFDYHQYPFEEEVSATCKSLRSVFHYATAMS